MPSQLHATKQLCTACRDHVWIGSFKFSDLTRQLFRNKQLHYTVTKAAVQDLQLHLASCRSPKLPSCLQVTRKKGPTRGQAAAQRIGPTYNRCYISTEFHPSSQWSRLYHQIGPSSFSSSSLRRIYCFYYNNGRLADINRLQNIRGVTTRRCEETR